MLGAAGGIAIGLAVGWVIAEIRKRLDDPPVEVTISLLTRLRGLRAGRARWAPRACWPRSRSASTSAGGRREISSARQRVAGYSMWTILTFLLNALLFVLIGLQLPLILDGLEDEPLGELIGIAAGGRGRGDRHAGSSGCT